jgi:hypothetical protein
MRVTRPHRPSHATIVAYLALFIALGGTAGALAGKNSVDSRDLKPKAVHASDLAKGAVISAKVRSGAIDGAKVRDGSLGQADLGASSVGSEELAPSSVNAGKLDLYGADQTMGSIPVTGGNPQDLGPSITLNLPSDGVVVFFAQASIGTSNNNTNCRLEARFGNTSVFLLEADPDSGNPPLPEQSPLMPLPIRPPLQTGQVNVKLAGSLNGVLTNTCTYVNPQLLGFVIS